MMCQEVDKGHKKVVAFDTCCRIHIVHVRVNFAVDFASIFEVERHDIFSFLESFRQRVKFGGGGDKVSTAHDLQNLRLNMRDPDNEHGNNKAKVVFEAVDIFENT